MSMQQWWNDSEKRNLQQVLTRRKPCPSAPLFNLGAV